MMTLDLNASTTEAEDRNSAAKRNGAYSARTPQAARELDHAIATITSLLDRGDLGWQSDSAPMRSEPSHFPPRERGEFPKPSTVHANLLRHLIEAQGATQARVASDTGIPESTIFEVLALKRGLRQDQITTLAQYFRVRPEVFGAA